MFSEFEIAGAISEYNGDSVRVAYWYIEVDDIGVPLVGKTWSISEAGVSVQGPKAFGHPGTWSMDLDASVIGFITESGQSYELRFVSVDSSDRSSALSTIFPGHLAYQSRLQLRNKSDLEGESNSAIYSSIYASSNTGSTKVSIEVAGTEMVSSFKGFFFYASMVPGGPYLKLNKVPILSPTRASSSRVLLAQSSTTAGSLELESSSYTSENRMVFEYSVFPTDLEDLGLTGVTTGGASAGVVPGTRLYFIVTDISSLNIDSGVTSSLEESYPSVEVFAAYVNPYASLINLPLRSAASITESMALGILGKNPGAAIYPGSPIRDILDPISLEVQHLYTLQDVAFKMSSWTLLDAFDDANQDGYSDDITPGSEKYNYMMSMGVDAGSTQDLTDKMFDLKANNDGITRASASRSSTSVTFYTSAVPSPGLYFPRGTGVYTQIDGSTVYFYTETPVAIPYDTRDAYLYAPRNRYEVTVPVTCSLVGTLGNVAAQSITSMALNTAPGIGCINYSPAVGGSLRESNSQLSARARLSKAGRDRGTKYGYELTARSTPGVEDVLVVPANDPLMKRDYNYVDGKHQGGMVDIYLRGSNLQLVEDKFSLSSASGVSQIFEEKFQIVSAKSLSFRSRNPSANPSSPIISVTRVYNSSKGEELNLSSIQLGLGDGDMIELSRTANQGITVNDSDLILVTYSLRNNSDYLLSQSPVISVSSVRTYPNGEVLPTSAYTLVRGDSPTHTGASGRATDYIRIDSLWAERKGFSTQVNGAQAVGARIGSYIGLDYKGIDLGSVTAVLVDSGEALEKDLDFSMDFDPITQVASFKAEPNGMLADGDAVQLAFTYGQNFVVQYQIDGLVTVVQKQVDADRHLGANVLVKAAIRNEVALNIAVAREAGSSEAKVASDISVKIQEFIAQSKMGRTLKMDDIMLLIRNVRSVYKVYPPTVFCRAAGSFIANEKLGRNISFREFATDSNTGIKSYISVNSVLDNTPVVSGGNLSNFRAVYEDEQALKMVDDSAEVCRERGRGYIVGDGRIVVSTIDGTPPQTKTYLGTYYTFNQDKSADIATAPIEYLSSSPSSITIDASEVLSAQRR